jgi:hypothetical protein
MTALELLLFLLRTFQNGLQLLQLNLFSAGKRLWIFSSKQVCEIRPSRHRAWAMVAKVTEN